MGFRGRLGSDPVAFLVIRRKAPAPHDLLGLERRRKRRHDGGCLRRRSRRFLLKGILKRRTAGKRERADQRRRATMRKQLKHDSKASPDPGDVPRLDFAGLRRSAQAGMRPDRTPRPNYVLTPCCEPAAAAAGA